MTAITHRQPGLSIRKVAIVVLVVLATIVGVSCRQAPGPQIYFEVLDGSGRPVDPSTRFTTGAQFSLRLTPRMPGEVYVLSRGTSGAVSMLHPENPGLAMVAAQQQISIPSADTFMFTDPPGSERVYLVFSTAPPLQELQSAMNLDQALAALQQRSAAAGPTELRREGSGLSVRSRGDLLVHEVVLTHGP